MTINLNFKRSTQLHCVQLVLNALSSTTLSEAITYFVPLLISIMRFIMLFIGYCSTNLEMSIIHFKVILLCIYWVLVPV